MSRLTGPHATLNLICLPPLHAQVLLLSLTFAFAVVTVSTFMSIPILLYGLGLGSDGWTWVHVALFSSMVASTDAVAGTGFTAQLSEWSCVIWSWDVYHNLLNCGFMKCDRLVT